MTCERWREAISATVDGEPAGLDEALVTAHLRRCSACRDYRDVAERTRRTSRVQAAAQIPDLSRRIVKLNALADRAGRWGLARGALAVVAVEVIVLSFPSLVLGDSNDATVHGSRHLGAFSVAYSVALLVVVVRPARARAVLPVAAVLGATLVITALVDVTAGHVPLLGEAVHIPELLSVLLVWLLAVPASRRRTSHRAARPSRPAMRIVEDVPRTG